MTNPPTPHYIEPATSPTTGPGSNGYITLTKHTAVSISVLIVVAGCSIWIATTMENLKGRLSSLESNGSQPMREIVKTMTDLRIEVNRLSDQVSSISKDIADHVRETKVKP